MKSQVPEYVLDRKSRHHLPVEDGWVSLMNSVLEEDFFFS
jgi:hypothetical protein